MKLSKNNIFSFLAGGVVCLTTCISMSSNDAAKTAAADGKVIKDSSEASTHIKSLVQSLTVSPEIPAEATFCGQEVDLTRYNMYEGLDRELSSFTYFHSTTMLFIKRANRFFPIIEPILKANGIPDDFKYLAVIESHLDPRAVSPARAVGLWQFMEDTAKQYGLTITPTVDERCHVEKSTEAACRYLKAAYTKYGDWVSVASAYNAGIGRISGELTKQQADSSLDLWLVEETSRYVYRIIAIKQIFENPYKYGFVLHASNLYKPIDCKEVAVSSNILDLSEFAQKYNITYADLKRFNPWLRDRKLETAGKTYKIKIPKEKDIYYKTPNTVVHNPDWVVR